MFKRGVSPVIATVLLLVITVVIASIIFAFVVPFVNKSLGNSKACLNVIDSVEFPESKFNCYRDYPLGSTPPSETGFSVKVKKPGVTGVRVALIDKDENSKVSSIYEGTTDPDLRPVGTATVYNTALVFPSNSGQRTYVSKGNYTRAEISPIVESGDICAVSDTVEFTKCTSDVVL